MLWCRILSYYVARLRWCLIIRDSLFYYKFLDVMSFLLTSYIWWCETRNTYGTKTNVHTISTQHTLKEENSITVSYWGRRLSSTEAVGYSPTKNTTQEYHLHVLDERSGRYFLIGFFTTVSIIQTSFVNQIKPELFKLYAADATEIDTYSEQNLELHLNLRRSLKWNFVIANVGSPIIGADLSD